MNLNYDELSIDEKGRITLPSFMNFRDNDEIILFMHDDYIALLFSLEVEQFVKDIINDKNIRENKQRRDIVRNFSSYCVSVKVNYSEDHGIRINLTKQIVSKYNFEKKLIYEIADNGRIRLWNPDKFLEYSNNLEKITGRRK